MGAKPSSVADSLERETRVRAALSAILESRAFQGSPGLGRLLSFLVDESLNGNHDLVKETYVGHTLYGRPATYDPRFDSVVRVNANRLRRRLLTYYLDNPDACPRILLQPGSYVPHFEFESHNGEPPPLEILVTVDLDAHNQTVHHHPPPLPQSPVSPEQPLVVHDGTPGASLPAAEPPAWPGTASSPPDNRGALQATGSTGRGWRWVVIGLVALSFVALASIALWRRSAPVKWMAEPFSNVGGIEEFPAISPSGRQIAFSWTTPTDAKPHIYLQSQSGQYPRQLTSGAFAESRPAWSPDGTTLAFVQTTAPGETSVFLHSFADGHETRIANLRGEYPWLCILPRLSWSPDGARIYTSESTTPGQSCGLVAINVKTGSIRQITQAPPGSIGDLEAAVSPDGKSVAFLRAIGTLAADIYVTSTDGGGVRRVTTDSRDIIGFCWSENGNGFITSSRRIDGVPRLWKIGLQGTQAEPLTDGLTLTAFPSLSADGNRITFTTYRTTSSIWQVSANASRRLVDDSSANSAPQLSPDGQSLLYRSERSGSFELWRNTLGAAEARQITHFSGAMVNNPRWSPDGKQIAFECRANGNSSICISSADRPSHLRMLNAWTANEIFPSWSGDGKSIYFASNDSGRWEIYRQGLLSREPVAMTHDGAMRALESADGRWLYVFRSNAGSEIMRLPLFAQASSAPHGAQPVISFKTNTTTPDMLGRWDVDKNGVVYLDAVLPANAGTPQAAKETAIEFNPDQATSRAIASVTGPSLPGDLIFSVSRDGNSFLYVKQGTHGASINLLLREPRRQ